MGLARSLLALGITVMASGVALGEDRTLEEIFAEPDDPSVFGAPVDFHALLADPGRFDGKLIILSGLWNAQRKLLCVGPATWSAYYHAPPFCVALVGSALKDETGQEGRLFVRGRFYVEPCARIPHLCLDNIDAEQKLADPDFVAAMHDARARGVVWPPSNPNPALTLFVTHRLPSR